MDHSLNIYQRMVKAMEALSYIKKEDKKVNGQYTFVSHDAVTAKCREQFIKHGIYARPTVKQKKVETVLVSRYDKYLKQEKQECNYICEVEVEYTFINIDNPDDKFTVNSVGQGIDPQDKACGKAISYACKYALLKALSIETGDDNERDVEYKISSASQINIIDLKRECRMAATKGRESLRAFYKALPGHTREQFIAQTDETFLDEMRELS